MSASFAYDGDGQRVKSSITVNSVTTTTYFVGAHYEVTDGVVTKYYYAGAQRIAMRTNGTLKFLLGDHLGSTSLTTDSSGNVVSELRYTAWGEVRYASGTTPTKYTFTGQMSYTEQFGLMFFNARWLDVSLGRFAQADSITPGGLQGYDRYVYVNNSPTMFTDPSGHKCMPEDECTGLKHIQPRLTQKGKRVQDLYLYYATHPDGEWNSNGGAFTAADFLAWIVMIESGGNVDLLGYNMQVYSRQLWGTGYNSLGVLEHAPYCLSSPCVNGVFNFIGAYSQSVWGRHSNLIDGNIAALEQNPTNYDKYLDAGYTIQSVGNDVVIHPKWIEYNNDLPTQSGNYKRKEYGPSWIVSMCPDTQMFSTAIDGIVVYTLNQANFWKHHKSGMCSK
jgi:RHS repeat-associated protein